MNAVLKPQSNQPEPRIEAVFKTSRAMATLWEIASDHLSLRQLEWFANGASEQVGNDLRALSRVLEGTGCLVASDTDSGSFQNTESTADLLFNLHNHLDAIAGLADIASNAGAQARDALKAGNV